MFFESIFGINYVIKIMGSTELIANLFRISQTEEKLRKDNVMGAEIATSVHYNVGREVRTAIEKNGGTMPEDLPTPEKSIQQIEKEQMARCSIYNGCRYLYCK